MLQLDTIRTKAIVTGWMVVLGGFALACASSNRQTEEEEPESAQYSYEQVEPYDPTFSYDFQKTDEAKDADISLGIIAPNFGSEYQDSDTIRHSMAKAIEAGFKETLTAKGFTFRVHESIDEMTYPQKKGLDFMIRPKLRYKTELKSKRTKKDGKPFCAWEVTGLVSIDFTAIEPLSGQKVWVKNVEPKAPKQTLTGDPADCRNMSPRYLDSGPTIARNAWAKGHEAIYQKAMEGFDKFINIKEFRTIVKSARETRERTRF
jgi:hypothetical protein